MKEHDDVELNSEIESANKEEKQEEVVEEKVEEETQEEQDAKAKGSVIDWIKDKLSKGESTDSGEFQKEIDGTKEEKSRDVPDEFVKAATKAGWTEKEIIEFASDYDDDKALLDVVRFLEEEEPAKESEAKKQEPLEKEEESKKEEVDEKYVALRKELDDLKERLGADDAKKEVDYMADLEQKANEYFDKLGEDFEVFGKTSSLPTFPAGDKKGQYIPSSPAYKVRDEVYTKALAFHQLGQSWTDSMEDAFMLYKGKHLEQDVQRGFIKKLRKNESRLSAKRVSKGIDVDDEVDEPGRRENVVRDIARKAGVKGLD